MVSPLVTSVTSSYAIVLVSSGARLLSRIRRCSSECGNFLRCLSHNCYLDIIRYEIARQNIYQNIKGNDPCTYSSTTATENWLRVRVQCLYHGQKLSCTASSSMGMDALESIKGKRAQKVAQEAAEETVRKVWILAQLKRYDILCSSKADMYQMKALLVEAILDGRVREP